MDEFRCAKCCGLLTQVNGSLVCRICNQNYKISDGIYDFRVSRKEYDFNPIESDKMESLIGEMTATNWESTIRQFLASLAHGSNNQWIGDLVVNGRYAWKFLLNLRPDQNLLDLGCGLGNLSSNIAPHVGKVYAMDLTYRRLQFSRKRFSIFNKNNDIELIAAGDGRYLPFADNSLDTVVLSGVLEWVGVGDTSSFNNGSKFKRLTSMLTRQYGRNGPREIQLRVLKEIRRVLKPAGQLFVGIENRLNAEHFGGQNDCHSGLKYGSLLPRTVANLYSILAHHRPYRTYTYSIPGYRRLLAEAEFSDTEFFGLFNGYNELNRIIPSRVPSNTWTVKQPTKLKQRIKKSKYFVPAYGIVAGSEGAMGARLQDRIFSEIENGMSRSPGSLRIQDYIITAKEKLLISADVAGYPVMIRIPLADGPRRSEKCNFEMLQYMHPRLKRTMCCPTPVLRGDRDNICYFVEERLSGAELGHCIREMGREKAATLVQQSLVELEESSKNSGHLLDGNLYRHVVTDLIDQVVAIVNDAELGRDLTDYFAGTLHGKRVMIGACHGDFGKGNLLVSEGKITGIIDWEAGSRDGAIVTDAINYLISAEIAASGGDMASVVQRLVALDWPVAAELKLLENVYDRLEVERSLYEPLVYLSWLSHVATVPSPFFVYNVQRIEQSIGQVVASIRRPLSR